MLLNDVIYDVWLRRCVDKKLSYRRGTAWRAMLVNLS